MLELLFLLLPLAAAYGYYMGKSSVRNKNQEKNSSRAADYIKGVEYLLNNDKDKAVDRFIAYLDKTDPSFESSTALANLFRQRGEVDRAISLHTKLAQDETLDTAQNESARLELVRDFIAAGILDRAEEILTTLVEIPRQRHAAVHLLVRLYEQEHDYKKAIEVALSYRDYLGPSSLVRLSNYYCEFASSALIQDNITEAKSNLLSALDANPNSIRARYELSKILIKENKFDEAYPLVKEMSEIDSSSGLLCLDILDSCFPNKADPKLRIALEDLVRVTKSAEAIVKLVENVEQNVSLNDAQNLLVSYLKENSNLKLFAALMRLRSKDHNAEVNEAILQLKSIIDAQIAFKPKFSCKHCGFESKIMFWQCPSCRRWDSIRPIRGIDGD